MVVSKDSKRKRKESPPPQPPMIESSPEMPKRTKVQAQRKFAQGQSAPTSSYTAALAASSSSTTGGPSASSESREPPTEILPNKRPKTEDFLTFLCFRGTSTLPAHLDFLNQGKPAEPEKNTDKKKSKVIAKTKKKPIAKKGGKKAKAAKEPTKAADDEPVASTSAAAALLAENNNSATNNDGPAPPLGSTNEKSKNQNVENEENQTEKISSIPPEEEPFSLASPSKKVAAPEPPMELGNPRSRATTEKSKAEVVSSKSPENKRRSNRSTVKDMKQLTEPETEEENYEQPAANVTIEQPTESKNAKDEQNIKKSKTPTPLDNQTASTPTQEQETGNATIPMTKAKKGKAAAVKNIATDTIKHNIGENELTKESLNVTQKVEQLPAAATAKAKQPIKRTRQKESPIFIPSPEPTGRMTRQRAFFEPVKVLPRDNVEETEEQSDKNLKSPPKIVIESTVAAATTSTATEKPKKLDIDIEKATAKKIEEPKKINPEATKPEEKSNSLNVFDFSSEDEQPLSKSIKLKKETLPVSPKKPAQNVKRKGKKLTQKKPILQEAKLIEKEKKENIDLNEKTTEEQKEKETTIEQNDEKSKRVVGKAAKKKQTAVETETAEVSKQEESTAIIDEIPAIEKKTPPTARQSRKLNKAKCDPITSNGTAPNEESDANSPMAPVRSQRPSRKTKEAAAIYMGIIGHKLQQNEDEDDELSLNSFPDLPNVKETEKMEFELKKNAATSPPTTAKSPTKSTAAAEMEKQAPAPRRGRPPKQGKPPPPAKREIEGMLIKKGALAKVISINTQPDKCNNEKQQLDSAKVDEEDEDFLLNEEVNETKRKLEKSFSDSDDEPLAVKVNLKSSDKDVENDSRKSDSGQRANVATTLTMFPISGGAQQLAVSTPPLGNATGGLSTNTSPITAANTTPLNASHSQPSFFKVTEKKSPIPNAKILNVPAAYNLPATTQNSQNSQNSYINKMEHKLISPNLTSSYLPPASPHYHVSHSTARPSPHPALQTAKSPTQPPPTLPTLLTHIAAPPPPPQSPLKYQTPPTTYPPPIEAYPSPKINPNFLTPKFDRSALPRTNNFPSPSPVKFDLSSSTTKTGGIANSTLSPKTLPTIAVGYNAVPGLVSTPTTSSAALAGAAAGANASSDPLKDEIGSILAANLMPSKEESGKIFGIASVSLAQSSGPDNTKCTLGKCGSIHKPVLGPVVPTEGYIGDQLSSKERRKAKVNMTHEQIQKWLIECSSNPDEIQDDLDDDYDDNLRPNLFATTPPPTRDDKESTSFSSSSKATRDLGKSESAWSGKGPSLKAIPVVATTNTKEDDKRSDHVLLPQLQPTTDNELPQVSSQTTKATPGSVKQNSGNVDTKSSKDKLLERRVEKKSKEEKPCKEAIKEKEPKQSRADKEKEHVVALANIKTTAAGKQSSSTQQTNNTLELSTPTTTPAVAKPNRKKNATAATPTTPSAREEKQTAQKSTIAHASVTSPSSKIQQKRTPVYNQKATQKQVELKETTTTSHKKKSPFSYTFGAFSVENEKSIYSFDKDDDDAGANKPITKPVFRRQSRRDSLPDDMAPSTPTPTPRVSPAKKRNAGGAVTTDKPHAKDAANASQSSSVSLTLSPAENCKLVKVSLEAEQQHSTTTTKTKSGKFKNKPNVPTKQPAETAAADSDSDGHTFYIPLQGTGTGGLAEGGIQGVAVKLGREGPEGPNQKVIMHATLVTKAQMGQNSKPLPDSMNASEIVKNLLISSAGSSTVEATKKSSNSSNAAAVVASTSSAAAAINSASNSLKSVPIGTVQPRFKGTADPAAITTVQPSTSTGASGGGGLVRVNSNSSLFSGSAKSRHGNAGPAAVSSTSKKFKDDTPIKMSNNTAFPRHDDPTQMVEAPIFRPTEKEFSDPMDFIERITPIAARFGICKIIPPAAFKPECRISDEMRFTAYNQYVHKMLHRWGPSAKELSAIKKYLATQSIVMNHPPWIGGMEVDLPRLYHTVQELGGLKEVIEKKKWARVAEEMCIPKLAQDRVTKLDDIYCKYLLPYDTLSPTERQKLFDEVEADWAKREARARRNADRFVNTESVSNEEDDVSSDDDEESEEEVDGVSMECIVKGRSMPLSQFYRIARNTMTLWFKNTEPTVNEVEAEFWRHVAVRDSHVCVHSGSIDSSGWGYGFPSPGPKGKGSNYARHPWNLKVLTNNPGSVLRSLGPVMGVTVPTLHVGMLFSACCWYRDPHGLSWIEYLHTGASKLWYGIPDDQSANFRAALTSLIPTHCQNKTIWLPCDTVMVPPHMLTDRGVSLCRIEQKPGEFIVVFPRAYTSSLATGYVVSESVYFATNSWLDLAKEDFRDIHDSCEPAMFSLEQLLFALGSDQRVSPDTLQQMLPMLNEVFEKETAAREQLKAAGVTSTEKVPTEKGSKSKKQHPVKSIESECDLCRANLYISMVRTDEGNVYCLQHALKNLNNGNIQAKQCKLIFAYHIEDIENLIKNLNDKIQQKRTSNSNKKSK